MKIIIYIYLFFQLSNLSAQDLEAIKLKNPLKFSGAVSANAGLSSINNGLDDRTSPYQYGISARMSLSWNKLKIPFYFSFRDHSYKYGTKLPKIRINPKYKWAQLQIGDVFMKFNRYTLAQRNMRGVAIKLTPGKFRFQALYGKMQELKSFQDTLQLGITDDFVFSNKVIGVGIGFGGRSSYLDLYILKAWNDNDSLAFVSNPLTRQDNVIVGSTGKLRIIKSLRLQFNLGVSALTYNKDVAGAKEIIGKNSFTGSVFEANSSTTANYAGDVSLQFSKTKYGLNAKVGYIQAFYQPLTVAHINSDVLNYTVGAYLNLFSKKLYINGNLGIQNDNLSGADTYTTNRIIYHVMANWKILKSLTANINYNNFTQDLSANLVNIENTYTYAITTQMKSLSISHNYKTDDRILSNRISVGNTNFSTVNDDETTPTDYNMYFARWNGNYKIDHLGLSINSGINLSLYDKQEVKNKNYGVTLGVSKDLLDKKLILKLKNSFNYLDQGEYREGTSMLSTIVINYKLNEKANLLLNLFRIGRTSVIRSDFSEYRSSLSYRHRF